MKTLSKLLQINSLTQKEGVWVLDRPTEFNYSDGESSELFLKRVVSEAKDLSSQSLELENCYPEWDWVSEYHLTFQRANLLRGLDLSEIENALEIGCGCGAITRYLGEQGIEVDAIEGAQRRADIARLRCRDLENVRVINANYNDLILPEKAYDAIFVIGVIEYAKKFLSRAESDEAAVITILKQLQKALTENGVLVIAIENRNGLKYWLGATEDHYGQPYVGLGNYWGLSGTRTYTYGEWPALFQKAGIAHWHFQFPFPDYKLPRVVLDQDFIDHDENAYSLLYRLTSRDYLRPWQPDTNEFALWRALHQSNQLKEYANSFLIVAGGNEKICRTMVPLDFAYYSGGSRKPEYRTVTLKANRSDQVRKKYLWAHVAEHRGEVTQQASVSPYIKGTLLSTIWLETILASNPSSFRTRLDQYYQYIEKQLSPKAGNSLIDALPANIVVDSNNDYHIIDQEWQTDKDTTAEYILFRSLLWFGHDNQASLKAFYQSNRLTCLQDLIEFGFNALSIPLTSVVLDGFAVKEDAIQFKVSGQKNIAPIRLLLTTPFLLEGPQNACMKIFWAGKDQPFDEIRSREVNYCKKGAQTLVQCRFTFDQAISKLRIMPLYHASEPTLLLLKEVTLSQYVSDESSNKIVWQIQLDGDDASEIRFNHFVLPLSKLSGAFVISDSRATLDFPVTCLPETDRASSEYYQLELNLAGEAYLESSVFTEDQLRQSTLIEQKAAQYQQTIASQSELIAENRKEMAGISDEVQLLKAQQYHFEQQQLSADARMLAAQSEIDKSRRLLDRLAQVKFIRSAARLLPGKYGWLISSLDPYQRFSLKQVDYDLIVASGLFDESFYLEYQPDLASFNGDPLAHYLLFGGFNGLNPHRLFDTSYYLKQCPELLSGRLNPLVHYLSVGANEGKNPCYLFDTHFYTDRYLKSSDDHINPLQHYLEKGGSEGFEPHPLFDTDYYYAQRSDARESTLTPLEHFILFGEMDQLSPTALFDSDYYLAIRPHLKDTDISGFRHFIEHGFKESRELTPFFNTRYYFSPDLTEWEFKTNPLSHYIEQGQYELRSPSPFFDPIYYQGQYTTADKQNLKDPYSHFLTIGEGEEMNPHPLFNTSFYRNQLAKTDVHPEKLFKHFILKGIANGCMSYPLFEPGYCLAQLPHEDISANVRLLPYYGKENHSSILKPHPLFDADYYRSQLSPEDSEKMNPLVHYVTLGLSQGLSTHPDFDLEYYTKQDLEPLLKDGQSPLEHFIYHGGQKERWPNQAIEKLAYKPQLGLVLLIEGPELDYLPGRVLAIISQLYPRWRMTVVVRNPDESDDYQYAKALAADDPRIHWVETDDADSAATLLNRAMEKRTEEYVVFLSEQMYLKAHALLTFVRRLNLNRDLTLIYTDPNQNDSDGTPIEKLNENLKGMSIRFFIGPLACFKRQQIEQIGGFSSWHQSAYDKHFLAHYLHQAPSNSVMHIAESLHFTMAQNPLHIVVRNQIPLT